MISLLPFIIIVMLIQIIADLLLLCPHSDTEWLPCILTSVLQ